MRKTIFLSNLDKQEITRPDGALVKQATLTRTGIFLYLGQEIDVEPANKVFKIMRTESAVNNEKTINSLKGATVTLLHVDESSPKTYKNISIGHIGDDVYFDGKNLRGTIYIKDATAIKAIKEKKIKELSIGYDMTIEPAKKGAPYDFVHKTPMNINHIALVPAGRAGSGVRILDGENMTKEELKKLGIDDSAIDTYEALDDNQKTLMDAFFNAKNKEADEKIKALEDSFKKLQEEKKDAEPVPPAKKKEAPEDEDEEKKEGMEKKDKPKKDGSANGLTDEQVRQIAADQTAKLIKLNQFSKDYKIDNFKDEDDLLNQIIDKLPIKIDEKLTTEQKYIYIDAAKKVDLAVQEKWKESAGQQDAALQTSAEDNIFNLYPNDEGE